MSEIARVFYARLHGIHAVKYCGRTRKVLDHRSDRRLRRYNVFIAADLFASQESH
jgi:hypothetical protein